MIEKCKLICILNLCKYRNGRTNLQIYKKKYWAKQMQQVDQTDKVGL